MATMRCPECGRDYRLSATRCRTCDVDLVETLAGDSAATAVVDDVEFDDLDEIDDGDGDAGASDADDVDDGAGDGGEAVEREQVAYELNEWSGQARVLLDQLLAGANVTRVWEGTDLVVRAADEELVDELVEQVRATDEPVLDPEAEKIVYEVNDWTSDQLSTLTDALVERAINYEFDIEGDLVVLATDEDGVEALLDVIEFGPADDAASDAVADDVDDDDSEDGEDNEDNEESTDGVDLDDGLETAQILSDLFVACDRLQKHASDHQGVLGAVAAANRLEGRALPFGYEPGVWNEIQADAVSLRADIEGDGLTDIELQLRAKAVRELLRDYV
jgi:hypothetical protein